MQFEIQSSDLFGEAWLIWVRVWQPWLFYCPYDVRPNVSFFKPESSDFGDSQKGLEIKSSFNYLPARFSTPKSRHSNCLKKHLSFVCVWKARLAKFRGSISFMFGNLESSLATLSKSFLVSFVRGKEFLRIDLIFSFFLCNLPKRHRFFEKNPSTTDSSHTSHYTVGPQLIRPNSSIAHLMRSLHWPV